MNELRGTTHMRDTCGSASLKTYIILVVVNGLVPNTTIGIISGSNDWRNVVSSGSNGTTSNVMRSAAHSLHRVYDLSIIISAINQPKISTNFIAFSLILIIIML